MYPWESGSGGRMDTHWGSPVGSNEKSFHSLPCVFGVILVLHGRGVLADVEDGPVQLAVDHALAGENHSWPCEMRGTCKPGPREIVSRQIVPIK